MEQPTSKQDSSQGGLDRLYAVMAHDVRGPANVVSITSELLETSIERAGDGEIDREKLRRHARTLKVQSRRLARRLDAVLQAFCGPPPNEFARRFDLGTVAEEGLRQAASHAGAAGHNSAFEGPETPVQLSGHPAVIRQAVAEVVANALEAMPNEGRLIVRIEPREGATSIVVEDSGGGIATADLDRIFDRDFTTKEQGRGFGLHFAREAVAAHGGWIEVESQEGQGSRVRMILPLPKQEK